MIYFYSPVFQLDFAQVIHFNHLSLRKWTQLGHNGYKTNDQLNVINKSLKPFASYLEIRGSFAAVVSCCCQMTAEKYNSPLINMGVQFQIQFNPCQKSCLLSTNIYYHSQTPTLLRGNLFKILCWGDSTGTTLRISLFESLSLSLFELESLCPHTTGSSTPWQFFASPTSSTPPLKINNFHLESLICGIKQQFNPILSQVQYEVMAEWRLEGR